VLASLAEGLRVVAVLLVPYLPASMGILLAALGSSGHELGAAEFGGAGSGSRVETIPPLFPKL
jgi:methionyl-tRNA synthetase